jgi:hypothetical protein
MRTPSVYGEMSMTLSKCETMYSARSSTAYLRETGPLSQEIQVRRKALRIRYINTSRSMEVRNKRPGGVQVSPLNPLYVSLCRIPDPGYIASPGRVPWTAPIMVPGVFEAFRNAK